MSTSKGVFSSGNTKEIQKTKKTPNPLALGIIFGFFAGIGFGAAIGLALGNIAIGIAVGIGIGSAIGITIGAGPYQRHN